MPRDPGSPAAWLRYARSDLALSKQSAAPGVLRETLCFHAQQAVEKSVKAVLIHFGVAFPKVHSIERLIDLLPPGVARTDDLVAAGQLTAYATIFRYPGEHEPVTEEQYRQAVRLAEAGVVWAQEHLRADSVQ